MNHKLNIVIKLHFFSVLAKKFELPPKTIEKLFLGVEPISKEIDERLCKEFGLPVGFFTELQTRFERLEE